MIVKRCQTNYNFHLEKISSFEFLCKNLNEIMFFFGWK